MRRFRFRSKKGIRTKQGRRFRGKMSKTDDSKTSRESATSYLKKSRPLQG